jgi:D-alanyl-D-alanine dipeptidase
MFTGVLRHAPLLVFVAACSSGAVPTAGEAPGAQADGGPTSAEAGAPLDSSGDGSAALTGHATQLVVVTSAGWTSIPAVLARYEASSPGGPWSQVGTSFPVVLGETGLGWGNGPHPSTPPAGAPVKHEGDGRPPAGLFEIKTAFGCASPAASSWIKLPFLQATSDLNCVDDPSSRYYTQTLYRSSLPTSGPDAPDWNSSEIMLRPDDLYEIGAIVNHNTSNTIKGGGSCIFLHIWEGLGSSTVGCTAGELSNMHTLLAWLDPSSDPLIVQLPQAVYDSVKGSWGLP